MFKRIISMIEFILTLYEHCTSVPHEIHTKYKNNNILGQFIVVHVSLRPLLSSTTGANT